MSSANGHFVLVHDMARQRAVEAVKVAPEGWAVYIKEPKRTKDQNDAMWPILRAFARQLQWPVNGRMEWMSEDDWKDVLTAAFRREQRVAAGLDGGFVMLGQKTTGFYKSEFSQFLEFLHATAAQRGVTVYQEEAA